ncbi:hypothetical protein BD309DRAFT_1042740 [Dichomitus squalens]|uniref:F-box domain-containing protein n=2 Tax=Dichomitus squalens TaxID=114155 RepID=A0A4Q9NIW3_9APHY|nr:uncharacterized protein DICSQDRAFT_147671 [Dichomitus squalens LYAD-421 SS1]EJF60664.1 hypothetical protein DICSQDRAFT_147671 [Dichomitus squalens LYAD-421 SS1]TBU26732.1 hypothetical protein BD311DRAFT_666878 [Dichomitus squalens]TBU41210.1 hypothetical protein BD309DRAFT_1042740 [Dichomitus squalens]
MTLGGFGATSAAEALPLDVLPIILGYLTDRHDLCTCAHLSKAFHHAATPILYRTLDVRVVTTKIKHQPQPQPPVIVHPSTTILKKPEYAKYVRHVREAACRKALRLCVNLEGFTWSDDSSDVGDERDFMEYLDILQNLPLREVVIRTFYGLSDFVWARLQDFTNLRKVSIWCMEGKPRILQGWSDKLGPSLTHLELGRCSGVPASILISVLSHLPQLRALRLKGAPSTAILEILTFLPHLKALDTEYFGQAGLSRYNDVPASSLRELTVRTSSVHIQGFQQLWTWIRLLTPRPGLESFTLNAFSTQGETLIPRVFILDMASTHKDTLKHFRADSTQMTMKDIECLCTVFPALETLSCATIGTPDGSRYEDSLVNANNLREFRMSANSWMHPHKVKEFVESEVIQGGVRRAMLRQGSVLRVIGIGFVVFEGRWAHRRAEDGTSTVEFEIVSNVVPGMSYGIEPY